MQKKELISFKSGLFELILSHEVTIEPYFWLLQKQYN